MSSVHRDSDRYSVTVSPLGADESVSGATVVEHTLPPRTLGAPLHRHRHEDELSHTLDGGLTVRADGELSTVPAGEFVVKGRDVWHTLWNAGEEPIQVLEITAPGEFSGCFPALDAVWDGGVPDRGDDGGDERYRRPARTRAAVGQRPRAV